MMTINRKIRRKEKEREGKKRKKIGRNGKEEKIESGKWDVVERGGNEKVKNLVQTRDRVMAKTRKQRKRRR
jgi:hypothetical protein